MTVPTRVALSDVALHLGEADEVAVATRALDAGTVVELGGGGAITLTADIPRSHKFALAEVAAGDQVHKYGQSIGRATTDIAPGDHVHTQNLGMDDADRVHEFGTARTVLAETTGEMPTFLGYPRADGRFGTRNYIGILTSVNCSATAANLIADAFRGFALDDYENVDGVMALTHNSGCGLVPTSEGGQVLLRTLRGYASHPNFGGMLVVGLGCEMVPVENLVEGYALPADTIVSTMNIQGEGGVRATVKEGIARIRAMLPELNKRTRVPAPVSELVLGLNCGGSDGYSGVTANPALGVASDRLVAWGGTSILAETPEVFGAEHLLTSRAAEASTTIRLPVTRPAD